MVPLFSKVDLNKLLHDVQNKVTLICAKFGKDLFNISKVIGRKKVAQFFWLSVEGEYESICSLLNGAISNDLGWTLTQVSRSLYLLNSNV